MPYDKFMNTTEIISRLGGTNAVARLCQIKPPAVSEWKSRGIIPPARLMFLRLARPDVFADQDTNGAPPTAQM